MKKFFSQIWLTTKWMFWKNKSLAWLFYLSFIFNLIGWGMLFYLTRLKQNFLILHYNAYMGIDWAVDASEKINYWEIFLVPIGGLTLLILNFLIILFLSFQLSLIQKTKDEAEIKIKTINSSGAYLLAVTSLLVQTAVLIYSLAIFWANG